MPPSESYKEQEFEFHFHKMRAKWMSDQCPESATAETSSPMSSTVEVETSDESWGTPTVGSGQSGRMSLPVFGSPLRSCLRRATAPCTRNKSVSWGPTEVWVLQSAPKPKRLRGLFRRLSIRSQSSKVWDVSFGSRSHEPSILS